MLWKIQNWLAKNWGWYTYGGLRGFHPRHWPEGYVLYDDGGKSVNMALGNAHSYARMFGGTVQQAEKRNGVSLLRNFGLAGLVTMSIGTMAALYTAPARQWLLFWSCLALVGVVVSCVTFIIMVCKGEM